MIRLGSGCFVASTIKQRTKECFVIYTEMVKSNEKENTYILYGNTELLKYNRLYYCGTRTYLWKIELSLYTGKAVGK